MGNQMDKEAIPPAELLEHDINRVMKHISTRMTRERQHRGDVDSVLESLDKLYDDVSSAMSPLSELRTIMSRALAAGKLVRAGPSETGLKTFAKAQQELKQLKDTLGLPAYQSFTSFVKSIKSMELQGRQSLDDHLHMVIKQAYPPLDSAEYFGTCKNITPINSSRLDMLRGVVDIYDNLGRSDDVNSFLVVAFAEYVRHALNTRSLEQHYDVHEHTVYNDSVKYHLDNSIDRLVVDNPSRITHLKGAVTKAIESEHIMFMQGTTVLLTMRDVMTIFDNIKSAVVLECCGPDIIALKAKGLDALRGMYDRVDQASRQSKIERDTSVAGVTHVILTYLDGLSKLQCGVEEALVDLPQRIYLPRPAPEWVSQFPAPQDACRFSLFFADCLECANHNLTTAVGNSGLTAPQQGLFLLWHSVKLWNWIDSNGNSIDGGEVMKDLVTKSYRQAFKLFLADWEMLNCNLLNERITATEVSSQLPILVERQKSYNVPDGVERRAVEKITNMIRPAYQQLYEKHSGEFTGLIDMEQLDDMLASML